MLVTSRNRGKKKLMPPQLEAPKPVNGSFQNRWQRRDHRNPTAYEIRASNPNGASSFSRVPTKSVYPPLPTPVIASPNIPCPVTILQPLTSPTLPPSSLTPAITSETSVPSTDPISPVIASTLNPCSETLFSSNGTLHPSDIQDQSLQSTSCSPKIISHSPSESILAVCPLPFSPSHVPPSTSTTVHHGPLYQPPLALSKSSPTSPKPSQPASIPTPRNSDSVQNLSPGKPLPAKLVPSKQPVCDPAIGALSPVHPTSPRSCLGVLGGSPGRSLGKHLPLLPNTYPSIPSSPGSGNLSLGSLHLLQRSPSANHPTKPDFHPHHSTPAKQHPFSQPNPCGNPSPSDSAPHDGIPLPGGHPEGVSYPGTAKCGSPSNCVGNTLPTVRLSRVLKPARVRSTPAPGDAKSTLPGSHAKKRNAVPVGGDIKPPSPPPKRKNLVLRAQNLDQLKSESEQQLSASSMESKNEFPELNRNLYPDIEPYNTGFLKPVVFLHGGPGGGTSPSNRKFFDPEFYRIILFDQRGAGKSTPHACLVDNTTWDLVLDIEKLREHLDIPEWQVFGGSWGSTLALAYSQSHPEKVTGIVLRGIFLLRKKEIDWFYEGGAAAIFPDAWEPYRDLIPENERGSFIDAYWKRLNSDDLETQYAAARAWTKWEMMTAHLIPNEEHIKKGDDDKFSLAFARIENHYFVNRGFLASDSFLLDNIEKIRHINTIIVQGRYDVCCPMMSAWDLHKAWPEADFKVVPDAGHSANEPGIAAELVAGNEKLKNIIQRNGP
ncbi:hypothetical protein RHMOL_Rhmol11G0222800 [Rhododendron molle]|uniref:Uncharacterized protein n=1 Tax=Rhododendron molle TaxID=49168 RepID=A0ACC0LV16_RHOML|nr:hypothetical protein RHMOL_Rhmol11G0222800 [Rhododendron molle]